MITMYMVIDNQIMHKRFYKNNTYITRVHYMEYARHQYPSDLKMLDRFTDSRDSFVNRNQVAVDDDFYFMIENTPIYGIGLIDKEFYSYNFNLNADINLTLLFVKDSQVNRDDFLVEVKGYLYDSENYAIYEQLLPYIHDFLDNKNTKYLYVEKCTFSMRKEDD